MYIEHHTCGKTLSASKHGKRLSMPIRRAICIIFRRHHRPMSDERDDAMQYWILMRFLDEWLLLLSWCYVRTLSVAEHDNNFRNKWPEHNACMKPFLCDIHASFYAKDKLADRHVIYCELSWISISSLETSTESLNYYQTSGIGV